MSELKQFEERLAGLIGNLTPVQRRKIAVEVAKRLRTSQQQHIKQQKAPDGTPYARRKPQPASSKRGRVKRQMFAKLRTNRFMKAQGSSDAAVVEFVGRVQRMVRIHQEGLSDKPNRFSREVKYDARPLLGFSAEDKRLVEEMVTAFLGE
ncbi:phage virion morphogenesis protein [Hafnia alvei]|uniref:phage virion morphogenesis protein n=1 Tax=Hafnia alvei TaxID=569 RepID=UPI001033B6B9|nr:phage virion morphogenesis protein [Hafnia alvei]TBM13826.1 phage virion morphogenesis protein [Hafnia alvei]